VLYEVGGEALHRTVRGVSHFKDIERPRSVLQPTPLDTLTPGWCRFRTGSAPRSRRSARERRRAASNAGRKLDLHHAPLPSTSNDTPLS